MAIERSRVPIAKAHTSALASRFNLVLRNSKVIALISLRHLHVKPELRESKVKSRKSEKQTRAQAASPRLPSDGEGRGEG